MAGGEGLCVEVLGPIRVVDVDGRDGTPAGTLQRRLLALLVLRRGRVVSVDAAVEVLWPSERPAEPVAALQNHLFRLRGALPDGVIEAAGDGYRLDAAAIDLDADRLPSLLDAAATPDEKALSELDALLARWNGPAYPELDEVDDGRAEAARLEELRTRVREVRAESRLVLGDTDGLVADLMVLADEQPLRERPRALMMTALATAGRQADALRVYDDFRRLVGDELGIEPSPALAAQHAALLAGAGDSPWEPASRLPVPATSLVGREDLAAEVIKAVDAGRLVTLVGPGGVGKTRLLTEVGHRLLAGRPDRPVVMCELATSGAGSAVDVVAAALGIDARPGTPLADRIVDVLGQAEIVLLADNCEHVLEPAAELVDRLLARCPGVRVVATSRERLRVGGEHVRTVPALPAGDNDAPAVQLFVERARAVVPDFDPDGTELACVVEIARRLDGLPLAIELAAARLHTHELGEVAAGLDQRFALLSSGFRASDRHGSLGAAVSWSYGLLDEDLQQTFTDLSVFSGSFDAAAAAAVCGHDPRATAEALARLVERSLVMRAPERRYVLLETLRAFGADELDRTGRADAVAERHARYQVDWVAEANRRLLEPGRPVLADFDAAVPELRSALTWSLDHGDIELAGRLVSRLLHYGFLRLRPDVLVWAEQVAEHDPDDDSPVASDVWMIAAYAAWMAGDVAESGVRSARALEVAEKAGDTVSPAALAAWASFELFEGRLDEAATWYRRSADGASADPGQRLMSTASEVLALAYAGNPAASELASQLLAEVADRHTAYAAYVWYCAGEAELAVDLDQARARYTEALRLAELTHASFITGLAAASKASIDARVGDPGAAADDYRRLIDHWRRAGMWSTQWTMLRSIAGLLSRLGRHRDAAILEGAVRTTEAGHRIFGADAVALDQLSARLRDALGDTDYEAARRTGAALDGDAAVEHALRAL